MLEKDVWVVWCLDALFRQPAAPEYEFKGGTSLSKVEGVIDRFSEGVDVTVSTKDPGGQTCTASATALLAASARADAVTVDPEAR